MTYRVYISTGTSEQAQRYRTRVSTALWHINEMGFAIVDQETGGNPAVAAQVALRDADLFIGVYGDEYGEQVPGTAESLQEIEYRFARERGLSVLVFMPAGGLDRGDEAMRAFKRTLAERHIIYTFNTLEDLAAQVQLAVHNYHQSRPYRRAVEVVAQEDEAEAPAPEPEEAPGEETRKSEAPGRSAPPPAPPSLSVTPMPLPPAPIRDEGVAGALSLDELVERAIDLAQDDIERIISRALELHDARHQIQQDPAEAGWMRVNPIFGHPMGGSQFQADIFMIMPFRDRFNAIYQNVIQPLTADLNLTIKRGDDFSSVAGAIMQEVWAALNACKLVIAETTEINPNVYYELGIAHTLGKPAILLTQETEVENLPFDIRHLRFIVYENTIAGGEKLEADLRRSIVWLLNDLQDN